jgi:hypothetical protein
MWEKYFWLRLSRYGAKAESSDSGMELTTVKKSWILRNRFLYYVAYLWKGRSLWKGRIQSPPRILPKQTITIGILRTFRSEPDILQSPAMPRKPKSIDQNRNSSCERLPSPSSMPWYLLVSLDANRSFWSWYPRELVASPACHCLFKGQQFLFWGK